MYVCICRSVTDTEIKRLVHCEGVSTMAELSWYTGAATQCGKCAKCAEETLNQALAESAPCDRPLLAAA